MLSIGDAVVIFPNQISMNISLLNLLIMRFIITFPMYKVLMGIPDGSIIEKSFNSALWTFGVIWNYWAGSQWSSSGKLFRIVRNIRA